jgi:hypothetical protein
MPLPTLPVVIMPTTLEFMQLISSALVLFVAYPDKMALLGMVTAAINDCDPMTYLVVVAMSRAFKDIVNGRMVPFRGKH